MNPDKANDMINTQAQPEAVKTLSAMPTFEQHMLDMQNEKVFGRNTDKMAREFQLLGLIDGYKKWGFDEENAKIHKEILREVASGGINKRLDNTFYEDGSIETMSVELKDGRVLTEKRIYPETTPELNVDTINDYCEKKIITADDSLNIAKAFSIMMGASPVNMDDRQIEDFRGKLGNIKNKITTYYNNQYQEAISHNVEHAKEGKATFAEVEGSNNEKIPVTILQGADFGFLAHVRNAMHTMQGETSDEDLNTINPKREWNEPQSGERIPNGLSTSFINNKKINLFYPGEIIFGFTDIKEHPIVTMSYEDIGSSISAGSRYGIIGTHGNETFMSPEKLSEKTGTGYSHFNELTLDRYSDDGEIIQPNCLITFGKNEGVITPLQKKYAQSFGIPIYVIDQDKYGGVNSGFNKTENP
jgi:hypothetical protein